jgi:hypothetical protein
MDRKMASDAIPAGLETQPSVGDVGCERVDVTLKTQEPLFPPEKQHPVDAPMRCVAAGAAFHLDGGVLVDKRSPFLNVAPDAGFRPLVAKHQEIPVSVRIVAVGADDQTLGHRMMSRQRELTLDRRVTAETELRLALTEEVFAQPTVLFATQGHVRCEIPLDQQGQGASLGESVRGVDQVRRMAVLTRDAVQLMLRMVEMLSFAIGFVATETAPCVFRWRLIEGEDQAASDFQILFCRGGCHRRDMRAASAVATLTALTNAGCRMGGQLHAGGLGRMAAGTDLVSNLVGLLRRHEGRGSFRLAAGAQDGQCQKRQQCSSDRVIRHYTSPKTVLYIIMGTRE